MDRKITRKISLGNIFVGGDAPISVQSMTNTKTHDIIATTAQIHELAKAGCDIVRLAIPDQAAALAIDQIKAQTELPLIADIHFDYRLALTCIERGIDGLRINPGNIGGKEQVKAVVRAAKERHIPIRIGVNAGSLDKTLLKKYGGHPTAQALVDSALEHIRLLEQEDFFDIKISLKAHDVPLTLAAYRLMAETVNYPLHLGVTEAGTYNSGVIKSAIGIGALLAEGIGDTLRVSLTGDPVQEVKVGNEILKALGLKEYGPTLISCPTCGRCNIDLGTIASQVEVRLAAIKTPLTVAVMGCIVNGPGEAKEADVGIAGGKGEGLVFRKGEIVRKVPEDQLVAALFEEITFFTEKSGGLTNARISTIRTDA
jgi:(E)-4-hydroxy-3-methylbut-2-enyl-diphosphate synthase